MKCPKCRMEGLAVVDSRPTEDSIRRRRKCLSCGHRFTTYESELNPHDLKVKEEQLVKDRMIMANRMRGIAQQFGGGNNEI